MPCVARYFSFCSVFAMFYNMPLFIRAAQTKYRVIRAAGGGNLYRASRRFLSEQRRLSFSSCMDTYRLRNVNECQVGK